MRGRSVDILAEGQTVSLLLLTSRLQATDAAVFPQSDKTRSTDAAVTSAQTNPDSCGDRRKICGGSVGVDVRLPLPAAVSPPSVQTATHQVTTGSWGLTCSPLGDRTRGRVCQRVSRSDGQPQ